MQVYLSYPENEKIAAFLAAQSALPYSYAQVGDSRKEIVAGFDNDHNKIYLGTGHSIWENAKNAMQNWQQFPPKWTSIYPNTTALEKDQIVVVSFHLFGIWWLNGARIVYGLDDENRFGFAYGTLASHVEQGEECFWIEKEADGSIYYHIRAFSKPRFWMAKLGYPLARGYQRKFVRQSMQQMYEISNQNIFANV